MRNYCSDLVQNLRRTSLAPLRKGSCQRKLTEGSSFQWRFENVRIRLLRLPGIERAEQTIAFRIP